MKHLFLAAVVGAVAVNSHAAVTLKITAADLQDSAGNLMSTTGLVVITSSTNSTFAASYVLPSAQLTVGGAFSPDEQVVYRNSLDSGEGPGIFLQNVVLTLSGGFLVEGAKLAIYWFPTLTTSAAVVGAGT